MFRQYLPEVHWLTIETAGTEGGVPDLNGCHTDTEFWIECKLTAGWTVSLRPQQIGWLMRRTRAGGNTYIAVRRKVNKSARRDAADELWLYSGADATALKMKGLRGAPPLIMCAGGPAHWHWAGVRTRLGLG